MKPVLMVWTLAACALPLAACSPELSKVEGFYSCADGGGCPPGTTCREDGVCRAGSVVRGGACDDVDAFCLNGLTCLQGNGDLAALEENRFCGSLCPDGDCPAGSECVNGECLLSCAETDCPREMEQRGVDCRLPLFAPDLMVMLDGPVCVDIDEMGLEGRTSCVSATMGPSACMPPAVCLTDGTQGVCSLRCFENDNCGMGGRCLLVDVMRDWRQCFFPCDDDSDCEDGGLVCRETGLPTGGTVCMPEDWGGGLDDVAYDFMP